MLGNLASGDINRVIDQAIQPSPRLRMDYNRIENWQDREVLKAAAIRIRETVDNARWIVGDQLIQAKRDVSHGAWLMWLREEWEWSEKTAQNYMAAARLIETGGEEYAALGATVQGLLGAHDPEIIAAAGPELLEKQTQGTGSGRGGAANLQDAKAAINKAAGRQVYTTDAPPPKAPPAPVRARPMAQPPTPAQAVYTGVQPDPVVYPTGDPDLVVVRLPVALAKVLRDAATGGVLDGFLSDAQADRLIGALDDALVGVDHAG